MVAAVRRGRSPRSVAKEWSVSLSTVQYWVARAEDRRLDRVDWAGLPRGGRRTGSATPRRVEDLILTLRQELKQSSALGEYGAAAIHRELRRRNGRPLPSIRTIGRILERRGALDGRRRVRRSPPPRGWYLPGLAAGQAELDSFDFVEGLVIRGGTEVMVLNAISLHGGLCGSWIRSAWTAKTTLETLVEHWRSHGLPDYAQFDNDTIFQGAHQWPDSFGRIIRLCLQLGVTPVFAPPRETGFQAAIEAYNGRWQQKVWQRFPHPDLSGLRRCSENYVRAARRAAAARIDAAPPRRSFPGSWKLDLQRPLQGTVIFLRRTNDHGAAHLLGRTYPIDPLWPHRLVRAEVQLSTQKLCFYKLRRREPDGQPLLRTLDYKAPTKRFQE
jgi:putative transposase